MKQAELRRRIRDLGLQTGTRCREGTCRMVSIPSDWLCIDFVDNPPVEGDSCCDCLVVSSASQTVVAIELKGGRYRLDRARRQLEGCLQYFHDVVLGERGGDRLNVIPVVLSRHHDKVHRRVAYAYRVDFLGKKRTIILDDCGISFSRLESRLGL